MIAIFLLAFTLSLFSFGTTPAAAGDVAGVSTHLFLTVLRDYDHDASFSVTYTDALGTHTKPYHAGMEVTAWSPVTITCTNHHVHDWSIDADVQEATIVGVGGITYPGHPCQGHEYHQGVCHELRSALHQYRCHPRRGQ